MILPLGGMICAIFFLGYILRNTTDKPVQKSGTEKSSPAEELIAAAEKGDYLLVKYLLSKKADCNYQGKNGKTALTAAAAHNRIECLKILIIVGGLKRQLGKKQLSILQTLL